MVSVGLQNECVINSSQSVMLQTIPPRWFWSWTILLVVLVCIFLALAARSDVLRDTGSQPAAKARKPGPAKWHFFKKN